MNLKKEFKEIKAMFGDKSKSHFRLKTASDSRKRCTLFVIVASFVRASPITNVSVPLTLRWQTSRNGLRSKTRVKNGLVAVNG